MKNELVKLSKLFVIASGGTPSRNNKSYYDNGNIPWIKTGDLKTMYISNGSEFITEIGLKESSAKLFPKGTVLIAMYGATIGNCSILNINAATNQACAAFRPTENILPEYLYYYLISIKERLVSLGVGGAQPNISLNILKQIELPVIPFDEQQRIVTALNKSQELINCRQSQITALDKLTQSMFLEMFFSDLRGEKKPFESAILDLKYGTSEKSGNEGVPVLRIPNISEGIIDESNLKRCHFEEKTYESLKLQTNDLLFVRSNGNPNYVGRCAKVTEKQQGYVYASYLIRAKIDLNVVHPDFIVYYLNTEYGRREVLKRTSTSAGQYNINTKGLKNLAIIAPLLDRQNEFVHFKKEIDARKYSMEKSLNELNNLFNSLLQRAFKGELFQEQS